MGNCQAVDTAAVLVQHPNGKVERLYSPVRASEIMKTNPGHYVALLISSSSTIAPGKFSDGGGGGGKGGSVRVTRIKLLRPMDTLLLGQVYRLVTTQEVMKGLWAKKSGKMRKAEMDDGKIENMMRKDEKDRHRKSGRDNNGGGGKSRTWQPSLQSISESDKTL